MNWTRIAALTVLLLALATTSRGQYGHGVFVDPSAFPQQGRAKLEGDLVEIESANYKQVYYAEKQPVTEEITVEVDGKQEARTVTKEVEVTVCKLVSELRKETFPTESVQFWNTAGEEVDLEKGRERLKAGETVLYAFRKVPSYYLSVFKPETLVLQVTPQPAMIVPEPAPADPAPAPEPKEVPPAEAPAPAADEATPPIPAGPQPTVRLATFAEDKVGLRTYVKNVSETTAMVEKINAEGRKELVPFSMETETIQDVEIRYPLLALKITTAAGKAVAEADLPKLLAKPRCVLVSVDGQPVSPEWLKIVRPEALIVVPPPMSAPMVAPVLIPPGPPPAPGAAPVPGPAPKSET
jgi:hypothetical protein